MASRVARLSSTCVFCSMATRRLLPRTPSLLLSPRWFTSSTVLARAPQKGGNRKRELEVRDRQRKAAQTQNYPPRPKKQEEEDDTPMFEFEPEPTPPSMNLEVSDNIMRHQVAYSLEQISPRTALVNDRRFADILPSSVQIEALEEKFPEFQEAINGVIQDTHDGYGLSDEGVPQKHVLESVYRAGGSLALSQELFKALIRYIGETPSSQKEKMRQRIMQAADIRHPEEWYFHTREKQRTWHLHVGPTNSGKTYHALKRLEECGNGMYAGPLRLLAHEVWERLNSKGLRCDLVTGDDIRINHGEDGSCSTLTSSTMEMVSTVKDVDVCVIDEIQMIGDPDRGWAWTQAVLGVKAKEVHLCGEDRVVPLIKRLAASVGDKLVIHEYKRLGPLKTQSESLGGDLKKIEKGDCVVTFSRRNIFAMKRSIEEATGLRCAVVYGSLPPASRSTQAALFNDPNSDYDVLVASDAVGMGLNLSIKRVIFESIEKFDGQQLRAITVPQLKQIAGRAGRYKAFNKDAAVKPEDTTAILPAAPQVGYVTSLEKPALKAIATSLNQVVVPMPTAGILPTETQFISFAAQFPPEQKFSTTIKYMNKYLQTSGNFHICSLEQSILVAELFDDLPLSITDRITFINAPIGRHPTMMLVARNMAKVLAVDGEASPLNIQGFDVELLDKEATNANDLVALETFHKCLILYIWLAIRYPATYTPVQTANQLKEICEERIEAALQHIRFTRSTKRVRGARIPGSNIELPADPEPPVRREDGSQFGVFKSTHASMACFVCGDSGHMARECPRGNRRGARSVDLSKNAKPRVGLSPVGPAAPAAPVKDMKKVICGSCGLKGHTRMNCKYNKKPNTKMAR